MLTVNDAVASHAHTYVYGTDDTQLQFCRQSARQVPKCFAFRSEEVIVYARPNQKSNAAAVLTLDGMDQRRLETIGEHLQLRCRSARQRSGSRYGRALAAISSATVRRVASAFSVIERRPPLLIERSSDCSSRLAAASSALMASTRLRSLLREIGLASRQFGRGSACAGQARLGSANHVGEPSDASGRQSTRIGSGTDLPVLVFADVVFITVANTSSKSPVETPFR